MKDAEVTEVLDPREFIGRRIGAALLDMLVLAALLVALSLAFGDTSTPDDGVGFRVALGGAPALAFFGLGFLYFFALEARFGQTLGKRALGIRVVRDDGSTPGAQAIVARTVLRVIDILPLFYLVGVISIMITKDAKRLGDLAAGTLVTATDALVAR